MSCPVIFTRSSTYGIRLHPDCLVFLTGKIHPSGSQFSLRVSRHRYNGKLAFFFFFSRNRGKRIELLPLKVSFGQIQRSNKMKSANKSVLKYQSESDWLICPRMRGYRERKIYYIRSCRKTHYMVARVRDIYVVHAGWLVLLQRFPR